MVSIVTMIVAILVTLVIAAVVTAVIMNQLEQKKADSKIGSAEERARSIIDDAVKTAEAKKRESLLEVKEESIKTKNELDREIKERRAEVTRYERRVQQKEENIDEKTDAIEKKEAYLAKREEEMRKQKEEISRLNEQRVQELERISGLTSDQAKEYLLKIVEDDVKHESAKMIKEMEAQAKEEVNKKAKDYVVTAIQKCAVSTDETTTTAASTTASDSGEVPVTGASLYGDVNLDGKVDITDAVLLNKCVNGSVTYNELQKANMDCNGDGVISADDTLTLLKFLIQLINQL